MANVKACILHVVKARVWECKSCKWKWFPVKPGMPVRCPHCKLKSGKPYRRIKKRAVPPKPAKEPKIVLDELEWG